MEPWDSWCALQMSYLNSTSSDGYSNFTCRPNIDCRLCCADPPPPKLTVCRANTNGGAIVTVTCAQYITCLGPDFCVCDADRCEAPPYRDNSFDITFNSDTQATAATGVVQFASQVALRLFR